MDEKDNAKAKTNELIDNEMSFEVRQVQGGYENKTVNYIEIDVEEY